MNTYNEAELKTLKLAEVTDLYNQYAIVTGDKQVKKFRDKPTAIARTLEIQEIAVPYMDVEPEPTAKNRAENKAKLDKGFEKLNKEAKAEKQTEDKLVTIGKTAPKPETAHGILISIVKANGGEILTSELSAKFAEEYALVYKGKHTVNISFAKGYIQGAIRRSFLK